MPWLFTLEALAIKIETNIVSGFLNYVTTAQKNAIQEPAKGQRFTTEGVGDVGVWGGGQTHAHSVHSSCPTPTSESHFNFLSVGFLIQEGRYYITSFVSLKRLVFTHPFILSSQPANRYLISKSWEYLLKWSQPPSAQVPVGGRN